jgi:hypothetical protein
VCLDFSIEINQGVDDVSTAIDEHLAKMRLYYVLCISVIRLEFDGLVIAVDRGLITAH